MEKPPKSIGLRLQPKWGTYPPNCHDQPPAPSFLTKVLATSK